MTKDMETAMKADGIRALIVEDSPDFRDLVRMALSFIGVSDIREATNGREALEQIREGHPDIVVMDWMMAELDGLECTRIVRSGQAGADRNIPIILLTGQHGPQAADAAKAAGVTLFMEKPFTMDELYTALSKTLSV